MGAQKNRLIEYPQHMHQCIRVKRLDKVFFAFNCVFMVIALRIDLTPQFWQSCVQFQSIMSVLCVPIVTKTTQNLSHSECSAPEFYHYGCIKGERSKTIFDFNFDFMVIALRIDKSHKNR